MQLQLVEQQQQKKMEKRQHINLEATKSSSPEENI